MSSTTTHFISPVNTRYIFQPYCPSSGIKCETFKPQNEYIFRICEISQFVQYKSQ